MDNVRWAFRPDPDRLRDVLLREDGADRSAGAAGIVERFGKYKATLQPGLKTS